MSMRMTREEVAAVASVRTDQDLSEQGSVVVDRAFHLPPSLYGLTVGSYLGFLAIMTAAFGTAQLVIPMIVFAVSIIGGFVIPYIWATMKPDSGQRAIDWGRFKGRGIQTHTGPLAASEAAAQVLTLPLLIFCWGLAVLVISSFVSG